MVPPAEVNTHRSLKAVVLCLLLAPLACGSWKRVGQVDPEVPQERLPQLIDPSTSYRDMGLLTDLGPLGFIATARIVAGPSPDTLLVMVALSIKSRGLTFRRDGEQFLAEYHIDIGFRQGSSIASQVQRDERVRVATFRETQRVDESVIFQQFIPVRPGDYTLTISVRDRGSATNGKVEAPISVPALQRTAISLPIAVYQATPRTSLDSLPQLVSNPRAVGAFGTDTLHFYIEAYGISHPVTLALSAVDASGSSRPAWTDSIRIDSGRVRGFVVTIPPSALTIGRYDLRLSQGETVMASTPFMVTFSDLYAVGNLQDIVSLLRYFAPPDSLQKLLGVAPEQRGAAWTQFWHNTDPNPATPENEAIDEYLRRVQIANERFRDEGTPGWLTERGEVFINLGEPSEIRDNRGDATGKGRSIIWNYLDYRLSLLFYDDTGFGHLRLDPHSRSEYLRVVNRLKSH